MCFYLNSIHCRKYVCQVVSLADITNVCWGREVDSVKWFNLFLCKIVRSSSRATFKFIGNLETMDYGRLSQSFWLLGGKDFFITLLHFPILCYVEYIITWGWNGLLMMLKTFLVEACGTYFVTLRMHLTIKTDVMIRSEYVK